MNLRPRKRRLGRVLVFQTAVTILAAALMAYLPYHERVPPGVYLERTNLSGLTKAEAIKQVENWAKERGEGFFLAVNGCEFWISSSEIGLTFPVSAVLSSLESKMERSGSQSRTHFFSAALAALKSGARPVAIAQPPALDQNRVHRVLQEIAAAVNKPPVDAVAQWNGNRVEIRPGQAGMELDIESTLAEIERFFYSGGTGPVEARVKTIKPKITASQLRQAKDILAIYVTRVNQTESSRNHNIRLAAQTINSTLVMPGETFSFNERLGPRLAELGYQKAPIISNQKIVQDVGGGICQLATTLYNAVLQAGFPVAERFPHSQPVTYVPLGRDAAIAGDEIDLKFRNPLPEPVLIVTSLDGDCLTAALLGRQHGDQEIKIITEKKEVPPQVLLQTDLTLAPGENKVIRQGSPGYDVHVYRQVIKDGQVVTKELISHDYYPPVDSILAVGPEPEPGK